ncbi:MAG: DnaK suppressor protein [Oceanicoccus sp.]|jgi:DnaK suppressor protein
MVELTQLQLLELKDDLEALSKKLKKQLESTVAQTQPIKLDQQAIGRVSRIDAIQQQEMVKANRRQSQLQLNRVQEALDAFDLGEFGFCKNCDESIGFARLKIGPDSSLCIRCQTLYEL